MHSVIHMLFPLIVFHDFIVFVFSQLSKKLFYNIFVSIDVSILIGCENFALKNVVTMDWIQSQVIFEPYAKLNCDNNLIIKNNKYVSFSTLINFLLQLSIFSQSLTFKKVVQFDTTQIKYNLSCCNVLYNSIFYQKYHSLTLMLQCLHGTIFLWTTKIVKFYEKLYILSKF